MAFEDLVHIFRLYQCVHDVFRVEHHDRAFCAEPEASCFDDLDVIFELVYLDQAFQSLDDLHGI